MAGALPPVPLDPLRPQDPREMGAFRILGRLGSGGMGVAFLAEGPDGWAVVKTLWEHLADDRSMRSRMTRELEAMRRVPAGVSAAMLENHLDDEPPWFAMDFVPGVTLRQRVADSGPLTGALLWQFASGLARGVAALASAGVVHRDLKPSNIVLSPGGPAIIDFSVASLGEATQLTETGAVVGSAGWLAPEQVVGGQVGPATDVHAWGLLVLFAATGQQPFAAENASATLYQVLHTTPDVPASLGPLAPLVRRALAKEPEQRPTPAELLGSMGVDESGPEAAAAALEAPTRLDAGVPVSPEPGRRSPGTVVVAGAVALLLVVAGAAGLALGRSSEGAAANPTPQASRTATSTGGEPSQSDTPIPTEVAPVDGSVLLTMSPDSTEFDSVATQALCSGQPLPVVGLSDQRQWPVAIVQRELNALYSEPATSPTALTVSGAFSVLTRSKARDFQRAVGLPVTGEFDEASWQALREVRCAGKPWSPGDWKLDAMTTYALGHRLCETPANGLPRVPADTTQAEDVLLVQWVADQLLSGEGPIDGVWSDTTVDAVKALQGSLGVKADGRMAQLEWEKAQEAYDGGTGNCRP